MYMSMRTMIDTGSLNLRDLAKRGESPFFLFYENYKYTETIIL